MTGIAIIDKPADWTSHDVVAKLRGALGIKRIGHGGTLDPMATGVLPIFIGRATRAAEFIENADKEYIAGLRLGVVTDTQDITGNVLSSCEASITNRELLDILPRFTGAQKQTPPMYSAVKVGGKKLYELARRGVEVRREDRDINIYSIDLLESSDNRFLLKVACSKGVYIRTLCHDIGEALGCGGALESLRRTRAGVFTIAMAHTLEDVLSAAARGNTDDFLIPVDNLFSQYPSIVLGESEAFKCKNGARFKVSGSSDGMIRVYSPDNEFLALCNVVNGFAKIVKSFYEAPNP